jgi:hypothetical protein
VQLLGDDPREYLPDGLPADPHQPGDLRLAHLLRQPRREILKIGDSGSFAPVVQPAERQRVGVHPPQSSLSPPAGLIDLHDRAL